MGESKIPIYAYVDESGNTGKNIFDTDQPDFFTAALVSKGDGTGDCETRPFSKLGCFRKFAQWIAEIFKTLEKENRSNYS